MFDPFAPPPIKLWLEWGALSVSARFDTLANVLFQILTYFEDKLLLGYIPFHVLCAIDIPLSQVWMVGGMVVIFSRAAGFVSPLRLHDMLLGIPPCCHWLAGTFRTDGGLFPGDGAPLSELPCPG